MTHMCTFAIALVLATTGVAAFVGSARPNITDSEAREAQMEKVTGQILIRFEVDVSETEASGIIARIGAREIDRMMDGKIYLVGFPYPSSQSDIIDAFLATEGIVYVEPNHSVRIPEQPRESGADDGQSNLIPLP